MTCEVGRLLNCVRALFRIPSVVLHGVNIGWDLSNTHKDFPDTDEIIKQMDKNNVSLGIYAHKQDVVQSGFVCLQLPIERVKKLHLQKDNEDTISK